MLVAGVVMIAVGVGIEWRNNNSKQTVVELVKTQKSNIKDQSQNSNLKTVETEKMVLGEKDEKKININTAGLAELDKLPGVGTGIGQKIIDYRDKNDGFRDIREIMLVKGIGEKLYEKIKDRIRI